MIDQNLQQKILQKLSPQQIQLIKLLEIPILELEQRIKKELEENPALEEGPIEVIQEESEENIYDDDDFTENQDENEENETDEDKEEASNDDEFGYEDYIDEEERDDIPYYKTQSNNQSPDDAYQDVVFTQEDTFVEHLRNQLGFLDLDKTERVIADYIIGCIDSKGYLQRDVESISDDLAFTLNLQVSKEEVEKVLKKVQTLDPPGVGARTLKENITIQLNRKTKTKSINDALRIVECCFDELLKKHYEKIQRKLSLNDDDLRAALNEIQHLSANPGGTYANQYDVAANQVIPDFIVEIDEKEIRVSLNSKYNPELRVSKTFQDMLRTLEQNKKKKKSVNNEAIQFAKQKIENAQWFIEAIQQRQNTLLTTMQAIVQFQREFFLTGEITMLKPMILKNISEITGFDISTISRAVSNKYVSTPYGIFSLKTFFSESLVINDDEVVSTYKVKDRIQELIEKEDKRNPLTDEEIAAILKKEGLNVARRTVAKYREQLKIPVARLRKEV
ncbi:MAG: RNA polymerase factor sigma-54 [Bacteroidales bacterium]|nr:RNA polymerase factor sigma-54 [Bacteroidales bacterium]